MNLRNIKYYFAFLVLLIFSFEILFGIVFWFKDVSVQAIHIPSIKDAPYLYYMFEPDSQEGRNEYGFYTDKHRTKSEKLFRIVLVGGSVAKNLGKSKDKDGYLILEKALNQALQTDTVEVINAGTAGYVLEQEFILTQLVLQKYKPDLIIGLDGYNDLMAFKLNRHAESITSFPPQNWRDFNAVEQGKHNNSFLSRITPLVRNNIRAIEYFTRLAKGKNYNDLSDVTENQIFRLGKEYYSLMNDLRDFSNAKEIDFYGFLQPVKWYDRKASYYVRDNGVDNNKKILSSIYHEFEKLYSKDSELFSLTDVLDGQQQVYTDDTHMTAEGHKLLSIKIAELLKNKIRNHPTFIKKIH